MLLGELRCVTDHSGLIIPPEFRAGLGQVAIVTRGIERCLLVYPAERWQELAAKMQSRLPFTNQGARAFARLMFSGALVCVVDGQGRIPLPDDLRRYAGIEDEAIVVGLNTHLEVWSPQRWQEVVEQVIEAGADIAEGLNHLGV